VNELEDFLQSIKLNQYYQKFEETGFDELETILGIEFYNFFKLYTSLIPCLLNSKQKNL
jgi:hypothetical protein